MNIYPQMSGTTYAADYGSWHDNLACKVSVFSSGGREWINCATCKIAVNLEAICMKVDPVLSYVPRKELENDKSDAGPVG